MPSPLLLGIVNVPGDPFSDDPETAASGAALAHARRLLADGADAIDLAAASSKPGARGVPPGREIARLEPVVAALKRENASLSIDSFGLETQHWALAQGVDYLNDVKGFPDPAIYPALAAARSRLIVMHSLEGAGLDPRLELQPEAVLASIDRFFAERLDGLERAGVARERVVLDPGMGFFLGRRIDASLRVLKGLRALKARFGRPVMVSVSRKAFLRHLSGRPAEAVQAATLAAELAAALEGADIIRTHDPGALKDALAVWRALDGA